MPARSCTELGAAMIALRVAELRVLAAATRAAASIEMELETSTARFALRGIHPEESVVDAETAARFGGDA